MLISLINLNGFSKVVYHADFTIKAYPWNDILQAWINGAPNPTNIIRLFNRLLFALIFHFTHLQITMSYIYFIGSLLFVSLAQYLFSKHFLGIRGNLTLLSPMVFLINPFTIDSIAKVGLIVSAHSLLLCLVFLRKYFKTRKFSFLLYFLISYNFGLIHPFYILINSIIICVYIISKFITYEKIYRGSRYKLLIKELVLFSVISILSFTYFLPLPFLHVIGKADFVQGTAYDSAIIHLGYKNFATYLLGIKPHLQDFVIYHTKTFYLTSSLILILSFITLFINKIKFSKYSSYLILLILYIFAFLLSTGTFLHVDTFLMGLYKLPKIGWIFRSHYKWLLYVGLLQSCLIVISLKIIIQRLHSKLFYIFLFIFFFVYVFNSKDLLLDVYHKLLIPKVAPKTTIAAARNLRCPNNIIINSNVPPNVWKIFYIFENEKCNYIFTTISKEGVLTKGKYYKYILTDCNTNSFGYAGYYKQELNNNSCLWINQNSFPHIYTSYQHTPIDIGIQYQKVDFQYMHPTQYLIRLRSVTTPIYLNFSESFHPEWKVRLGKFNWFKVLTDKKYFIPDKFHFKNDAEFNSFLIDPQKVCSRFDCHKNPDGSYDMDLTLYFKPQSYFYLGLIISGITWAGILGYLGWEGVRGLKKRYWQN